jgi:hypothetical protein
MLELALSALIKALPSGTNIIHFVNKQVAGSSKTEVFEKFVHKKWQITSKKLCS